MCDQSRTRSLFLGLLSGLLYSILFGLAYPPVNIWWLVALSPLPLVICADRTSRPLWSALGASLASLPMWTLHHFWIASISTLGIVPLIIYLALWPGIFVLILSRLARLRIGLSWLLAPIVWTGLEVLRAEVVWYGYPWFLLAHPFIEYEWMARWASVGGVYLLTLIISAQVTLFGWLVFARNRTKRSWNLAILFLCLLTATPIALNKLSSNPTPSAQAPPVRIGVVQTSVPQQIRGTWSLEQRIEEMLLLRELTRFLAAENPPPEIIIWPETMFPGPTLSPDALTVLRALYTSMFNAEKAELFLLDTPLLRLADEIRIPLVVGARGYEGLRIERNASGDPIEVADRSYNSVFVVTHDGITPQRYDKMHLTPFGEVMPYLSAWPWLESQLLAIGARGMAFDLDAGSNPTQLIGELADGRELAMATPICFEATVAGVCRDLVFQDGQRKAAILLNLTNDGWFGNHSGGREHHMLLARWRCIELGTPMVRAANTGISSIIDARGRIMQRGPQLVLTDEWTLRRAQTGDERLAGILSGDIEPGSGGTPYGRVGDIAGWSSMGVTICVSILALSPLCGRKRDSQPMDSNDS